MMIERAGRVAHPHILVPEPPRLNVRAARPCWTGAAAGGCRANITTEVRGLISYQYMITKALWPSTLIRALMRCFASTAKSSSSIHRAVTGSSSRSSGRKCRRRGLTACAIRSPSMTRTVRDWSGSTMRIRSPRVRGQVQSVQPSLTTNTGCGRSSLMTMPTQPACWLTSGVKSKRSWQQKE